VAIVVIKGSASAGEEYCTTSQVSIHFMVMDRRYIFWKTCNISLFKNRSSLEAFNTPHNIVHQHDK